MIDDQTNKDWPQSLLAGNVASNFSGLKDEFDAQGYFLRHNVISAKVCERIIQQIKDLKFIRVVSKSRHGDSIFYTANSAQLLSIPEVSGLLNELQNLIKGCFGRRFRKLDNDVIGVSVNVIGHGGTFSRHFDRNYLTVSIYLNAVRGGETLVWPKMNYDRVPLLKVSHRKWLMYRLLNIVRPVRIPPAAGTLLLFDNKAAHQVLKVEGGTFRFSLIFAFDNQAKSYKNQRDNYGYGESTLDFDQVCAEANEALATR